MSKQELIKSISKESKLKRKKSLKVFDLVFELIAKDLKKKRVVNIRDFGEFRINRQKIKIEAGKGNSVTVIPPQDIIEFRTNLK